LLHSSPYPRQPRSTQQQSSALDFCPPFPFNVLGVIAAWTPDLRGHFWTCGLTKSHVIHSKHYIFINNPVFTFPQLTSCRDKIFQKMYVWLFQSVKKWDCGHV
jgi:hypothetical protein